LQNVNFLPITSRNRSITSNEKIERTKKKGINDIKPKKKALKNREKMLSISIFKKLTK